MRREVDRVEKVTLNLFEGDMKRLRELYPRGGASRIIRSIVRAHIRRIDEKASQRQKVEETEDV